MAEVALFRSGLATPMAVAMRSVPWPLVLGVYIVVAWLASRAAHRLRTSWLYGWRLGTWFSVGMIALAGASVLYDAQKIHCRRFRSDRYVAAALRLFASIAMMFWSGLRLMRRARRIG